MLFQKKEEISLLNFIISRSGGGKTTYVMDLIDSLAKEGKESIFIFPDEEIWKYLAKNKWCNCIDLSLAEIVNDIITIDVYSINNITGGK